MITRADRTNDVDPRSLTDRAPRSEIDGPHWSPSRLANYWGVHVDTIYRDIRKGALKAFRLPSGQLRINLGDARRYGRPLE